jgi:hypothetical protein
MYNPTRSRTFSIRSGSGDNLKLSCFHGLRLNARQISATVVFEIPCLAASPRVDQWVSAPGVDSNVSTNTASMVSSAIVRSAPGRGASLSPSSRSVANRRRHFDTVAGCTRSAVATSWFVAPSAQANTIRDRWASAWAELCRRTQRCKVSRSVSLNSMTGVGRPARAMVYLQ